MAVCWCCHNLLFIETLDMIHAVLRPQATKIGNFHYCASEKSGFSNHPACQLRGLSVDRLELHHEMPGDD